jgi:Rne/Rng family ribonuclease
MRKSIVISEQDSIAALLENDRCVEFFVNRGELLLGDIYTASVENILPGIDAAFVNLGKDKMGFLHANDVPGQGPLKERLVPKQKLLVQITKEPTGHKGPRVSTAISLPGRFLVLVPEERGVSISRRIAEARERARLKSVVNLLKPPGVGLIIRTEAKGQGEPELFEDFEQLWDRWQTVVSNGEASIGPSLIYRDQDLLHRVLRDAYSTDVNEVIVDSPDGHRRAMEFLSGWTTARSTQVVLHPADVPLLTSKNIDREIEAALSDRVELPSGGHLNIQPTEALTVIDVNSGRFTSSRTQAETVRRTNLEAAQEIPRQLRLRNIGGMVIVDFIDMDSRKDQQQVLEGFQRALEDDRAKPQIGQLSDLGLVELTRRRQGQSLRELFTAHCPTCTGLGVVPTLELNAVEGRRLISTKPREEEGRGRRRGGNRGGASSSVALRAATITGGRVQQTALIEDEVAELDDVPQEILEQMPDDLLDQRTQTGFSHKGPMPEIDEDDEEGEQFGVEDLTNFEPATAPLVEAFEDDDDDVVDADDLQTAVVEAEQVRQEVEQALGGQPRSTPVEAYAHHEEDEEDEEEEVVAADLPEPYSPFEAEPETFSGVFRLKPKSEQVEHQMQHHEANPAPSEYHAEERFGDQFVQQHGYDQPQPEGESRKPEGEQTEQQDPWWSQSGSQQLELPLAEPEAEQRDDNEEYHAAAFPGSQNEQ